MAELEMGDAASKVKSGMFPSEKQLLSKLSQVIRRRIDRLGASSLLRAPLPRPVIYIDLGLHRTAVQIQLVREWFGHLRNLTIYGFEANPDYHADAEALFSGDSRVKIINAAVVGPDHTSERVTLNIGGKLNGLGDSLFKKHDRHTSAIEVAAIRLSEFMRREGIDRSDAAVIIRMNIEGAELHVLRDLNQAGLISRIDGWYGLWNDCSKIDPVLGHELEKLKSTASIENVSFNDRDSRGKYARLKEALIRYDIETMIGS